jgi:alkanesulfonate monooxygenase SsuD/methylene tetrahydromethanopterin reductase-like flavin-dependent oxidoreductase (luciferase family)
MMRVLRQTKYFSGNENRHREVQQAATELNDRVKLGQLLIGSPETVIKQIEKIRDNLGPGILDLTNAGEMGDKTIKSMELMATKVLPHIKDW